MEDKQLTFWDHLDELRASLIRIVCAMVVAAALAFAFKDQLFSIIFAAQNSDFITYHLLDKIAGQMGAESLIEGFNISLINTRLAQQFTTHISVALWAGFLLTFPYTLFELFRFIAPALYDTERRYTSWVIVSGYVMFLVGVALSYFLIFPLTFRFLATYQVSTAVTNMIALDSYISTLVTLSLMVGLIFELPIISWLLAKLGILTAQPMRQYRRHAVVVLLIISAIITPTADIFTLLLVALPIYLLYELSIWIVGVSSKS